MATTAKHDSLNPHAHPFFTTKPDLTPRAHLFSLPHNFMYVPYRYSPVPSQTQYCYPFYSRNIYNWIQQPEAGHKALPSLVAYENGEVGFQEEVKKAESFEKKKVVKEGFMSWSVKNECRRWAPKKKIEGRDHDEAVVGGKTTVMIRNIPNQFNRQDMLHILDNHCREENSKAELLSDPCRSLYDFLYLPMDFRKGANLGYAFVNFTSPDGALKFFRAFNKHEWKVKLTKKICVIVAANFQGREALENHFESRKFKCHTDDYLPVEFEPPRDGSSPSSEPIIVGKRVFGPPAAYFFQRKGTRQVTRRI